MKISIISASYRDRPGLVRTANYLKQQTFREFEWLVADGGSRDGTREFLAGAGDAVAWWVSQEDRGIFDAWNRAIAQASGEWIIFLGAGDGFHSHESLADTVAILDKVPEDILIAYGKVNLVKPSGQIVQTIGAPWDPRRFRRRGMSIPHQATFHRDRLFRSYGVFDPQSAGTATYEMLLRYLKDNDAQYIDKVISSMVLGGTSTQPRNHLRFVRAYMAAQSKHGTFDVNLGLIADVCQALAKSALFRTLPSTTAHKIVQRGRALVGLKSHY